MSRSIARPRCSRLLIVPGATSKDQREHEDMRKHIIFDLGTTDLLEESLDEETSRVILQEHDIDPDEAG